MKLKMMNLLPFVLLVLLLSVPALSEDVVWPPGGVRPVVARDQRKPLIVTEFGEISAVDINVGHRGPYHLQFFTLEPNSLFLPVLLHTDMIFYTHSGSGRLTWADESDVVSVDIKKGDISRVRAGSVFYVQSGPEAARDKLRVYAIFDDSDDDHKSYEPAIGVYSSITDLVKGFDKRILQAAFKAPEELIDAITNATKSPDIVHAVLTKKATFWEMETRFLKALVGGHGPVFNNKKTKSQTHNIFDEDPDFVNCNGWSSTVNKKNFKSLKGSNIGLLMVNLSTNSMMGPHWNPMATEIALVLQGQGMVRTVCSNSVDESECRNTRFKVREGDVFTVPRFHAMAQMSYSNDSFVFVGFSTTKRKNYPQFVAGKASVLQTLDNQILAWTFNVNVSTVEQLLRSQAESVILECLSCAEEEETIMEEEIERKKEEEETKRKEEEEERKRKQEEKARKREEEEQARRREEEQEVRRREEEEKRRQEEEAIRREEEERERERRRKEEEAAQREQEEARREAEEREWRRREEEARREEEERRKREKEAAQREQEEARREAEEREWKRREEEARREEKERIKREEQARREQEEAERQQRERQEEEERKREDEEERERQREEVRRQQEGRGPGQQDERSEPAARWEEEEARRQQEQTERKRETEEEGWQREKGGQDGMHVEERTTVREHKGIGKLRILKFWNIRSSRGLGR